MIRILPSGYNSGDIIYCYFPAYDADGDSSTIAGLAVTDIEIYKNGSTTQRTSDNGYSLLDTDGVDFDGSVGLHGFSVDTSNNSDAGFWADGSHYLIWVDAVTVDAKTVRFGFDLRLGVVLKSTTAGRTLDVSAGGEAGLDWANVGSPTTNNALTGTTISSSQVAASVTGAVGSVTGNVGGTVSTVTTLTNLPAIPANWLTAAGLAADAVTEIQSGLATEANQTTILNRLGAWTGTGLNTILGALRAMFSKGAGLTPSDMTSGGLTADNTTDSQEAIRDRGDSAWGGEVSSFSAAALAQLAGIEVTISPTFAGGRRLEIVQGDDYSNTDSHALTLSISGITISLTGATAYLYWERGATKVTMTATNVAQSGSDWVFRFEPTAAVTTAMAIADDWKASLVVIPAATTRRITYYRTRSARVLERFDD